MQIKRFLATGLIIFLCQLPAGSLPLLGINAENHVQLIGHTSQYTRVVGKVESTELTDKSKVIFLNFGKNFNTSFSALIYCSDIHGFIEAGILEPENFYKDKNVEVEGIIRISNGKPEIIVKSPSQIKIIDNITTK